MSGLRLEGALGVSRSEAFVMFATANASTLMRLAVALTGDRAGAEDITQVALEKVYVRWTRLSDPAAYARQIVVHACRDRGRGAAAREVIGLPDHEQPAADVGSGDFGDRQALLQAMRQLPYAQRAAIVLRYWMDLTEAETAAALGVGVGSIKSSTSRGKRRLRELLDPYSLER